MFRKTGIYIEESNKVKVTFGSNTLPSDHQRTRTAITPKRRGKSPLTINLSAGQDKEGRKAILRIQKARTQKAKERRSA